MLRFMPLFSMCVCLSALACEADDGGIDAETLDAEPGVNIGTSDGGAQGIVDSVRLDEKYSSYFEIGAAVDVRSRVSHADLLTRHFNSVTAENEMKFESLQGTEGSFNFTPADLIVEFAEENDMQVRGHALVWHRQNPSWLFQGEDAEQVSPELLLERMETHITQVMTHYRGRVQTWDVVNEAIMNDGSLRTGQEEEDDQKSLWYEVLGEDYIAAAFNFAAAADPDAKLFYNDYYNYMPERREAIYELLKGLLEDGVPVHGVGLQCHLNIEPSMDPEHQSHAQTVENLEAAIERYASLGLEVQITELDVSVYVGGKQYTEDEFYTEQTFRGAVEAEQAERYSDLFTLFRAHRDVLRSVTFWGIADDDTWLSEFSSGRKDFPLLFDTQHRPKLAYTAVTDF